MPRALPDSSDQRQSASSTSSMVAPSKTGVAMFTRPPFVDGGAVLEVRHVGLGHDLRDHALVAVAAGELVALGDLALLRHIHAHEVVDPRRQVVVVVAAEGLDVDDDAALAVRHL